MDTTEIEDRIVHIAAAAVWRRFRAYVEYVDLRQLGYLWLLDNEDKVKEWRDKGKGGERALETTLERHLARSAIKEKAARLGCKVDDFYTYRRGEVEAFLKGMFHNLRDAHALGARGDVRVGSVIVDPMPVELIDVERAWVRLPVDQQALLSSLLDADKDEERVAGELDISVAAVRKRKGRALRRMQTFLNNGDDDDHASSRNRRDGRNPRSSI